MERSEPDICRQRRLLDAGLKKPEVRLLLTAGEQRQFEGVTEEFPPEQPERSIRVKQEEEEEPDDFTAVTVKREEDEVHLLGFEQSLTEEHREPDQQQLRVKIPSLEPEEAGSCDFEVKEEADVAVKSERNEEGAEFSQLHQSVREDCGGPGLTRNSGPDGHLGPGTEDETHSSKNEDIDDWMAPLEFSQLYQSVTENREDCGGPGLAWNSGPAAAAADDGDDDDDESISLDSGRHENSQAIRWLYARYLQMQIQLADVDKAYKRQKVEVLALDSEIKKRTMRKLDLEIKRRKACAGAPRR